MCILLVLNYKDLDSVQSIFNKKLVIVAMIIVSITMVWSSGCQPEAAARLPEEESRWLAELKGFGLESLPRGDGPPTGKSGCTHGAPRGGVGLLEQIRSMFGGLSNICCADTSMRKRHVHGLVFNLHLG